MKVSINEDKLLKEILKAFEDGKITINLMQTSSKEANYLLDLFSQIKKITHANEVLKSLMN